MDVRFSPEQVALLDSVAAVVDRLGPKAVAHLGDRERISKLDAAVDASGWRELRTRNNGGGPWASAVEAAIVAEQLGRGVADVAFVGPTLAAELRRLTNTDTASTDPVRAHETVALTADLGGPGECVAIDAAIATSAVGVRDHAVVELSMGEPRQGVDLTRPLADVVAEPAPVAGLASDDLDRFIALGLALACADLVGVMSGAVTLATEYARERRQYGAPIGSYQAVQHLLADAVVATEGSRSIALHAAWAVDALPPPDAVTAAAAAKAYCARAARETCETVIQVHGGIGHTWEHMAHVYLRRALLSIDLFGGIGPSLDRVLQHHGVGASDGLR
jgi:alkylation response protein AidB-like acyl-CoA dehydrogenase